MLEGKSQLGIDLIIHAICLIVVFVLLLPQGLFFKGPTPPVVYPFFFIISTVTLFRQYERLADYQTRLILIPAILSVLLYGFCLINEMTRNYWAFSHPRLNGVVWRVVWYHLGLLLIHPEVYPRVWNGFSRAFDYLKRRGFFSRYVWVTCIIASLIMWNLRNLSISPDGYDWIKHSVVAKHWVYYLREPLGTYLFRLSVFYGHTLFGWAPYHCIALTTILCGLITTALMVPVMQRVLDRPYWGIGMAFLLSCTGYTQLFFGNIEVYALLDVFLAFYLFMAMRYLDGRSPAWAAGIAFGLLFCVHLSSGWWLPAFLILPYIKSRMGRSLSGWGREYAYYLLSSALIVIAFWLFVLIYGYDGDIIDLYEHFVSDQVMYVGADAAMFHPPESYWTWDYYETLLNEYYFLMPGGFHLVFVLFFAYAYMTRVTPQQAWFILLTGMYLIYSIVWHPDRKYPADWDIFSGLTIPMAIVLCQRLTTSRLSQEAIRYILYQATVFSGLYLIWIMVHNHIKGLDWVLYQ